MVAAKAFPGFSLTQTAGHTRQAWARATCQLSHARRFRKGKYAICSPIASSTRALTAKIHIEMSEQYNSTMSTIPCLKMVKLSKTRSITLDFDDQIPQYYAYRPPPQSHGHIHSNMCVYGGCLYTGCGHDYRLPVYKCSEADGQHHGLHFCPNGYTVRLPDAPGECPDHFHSDKRYKEFHRGIETRMELEGQLPDMRSGKRKKLTKVYERHCVIM